MSESSEEEEQNQVPWIYRDDIFINDQEAKEAASYYRPTPVPDESKKDVPDLQQQLQEQTQSRKRNTIDFEEEKEKNANVLSQGQVDIISVLSGHSHHHKAS